VEKERDRPFQPPPPDVEHFAITELGDLPEIMEHFSLLHTSAPPPFYIPSEDNLFTWPIETTEVDGLLLVELGADIIHEIDLAVGDNSALKEFIFIHKTCTDLATEASRRPAVDMVLLRATPILNGTSALYRRIVVGAPAGGAGMESGEEQGNEHPTKRF